MGFGKWGTAVLAALLLAACNQTPQGTAGGGPVTVAGVVGGTEEAPALGGKTLVAPSGQEVRPGHVIQGQGRDEGQRIVLTEVALRYEAKGPIEQVDVAGGSLVVLGVTVRVDALTRIYEEDTDGERTSLTLADLRVGDYVEVSGVREEDGTVRATRIERKPASGTAPQEVEVRGEATALDPAAQTFTLGAYTVDYSGAQVEGTLEEGAWVEVKGTLQGNTILATRVGVERPNPSPANGVPAELEGPFTGLDLQAQTFTLGGYTVDYSGAQVEGTLQEGAWVEVKGTLEGSRLRADRVKVKYAHSGRSHADHEVKGQLEAVDPQGGTLTVGGQTFFTDGFTLVERRDYPISLGDLGVGEWVEVKYDSTRTNGQGYPYAVKVEAKGQRDTATLEIKGPIEGFDSQNRTFRLMGYTVRVDANTRYKARDRHLSADEFFGQDRTGAWVEVKGTLQGDALLASKVKLK
ncbi:DUF5666 domain-containing protein [Thermus sp.]|uniref:DUF5666 domain-containing protein n=1 Tax=Thermus sp. TaxID=275 RepID=UPI00307CE8BE